MTPYDLLRTRINELLPERLELKLGCDVCFDGMTGIFVGWSSANSMMIYHEPSKKVLSRQLIKQFQLRKLGKQLQLTKLGVPLTITDVLRVLTATRAKATSFYIEDDGNLWQCTAPLVDNLLCTFNLSLPLSAPENEAACEAVLAMLTTNL